MEEVISILQSQLVSCSDGYFYVSADGQCTERLLFKTRELQIQPLHHLLMVSIGRYALHKRTIKSMG